MFRFRHLLLTLLFATPSFSAHAQPPQKPHFDGLVLDYGTLTGQPAHIQLLTGLMIEDTEIGSVMLDRNNATVQFIQYVDGRRKPKRKASEIYRMITGGKAYQFRFHGPSGGYYIIDQKLAEIEAETRLQNNKSALREMQSDDERSDAVTTQKVFLSDAKKQMMASQLTQHESQFSVLLTDFPPAAARELGQYIDQVCQNMNTMFGLPRTSNVWHGKVVVAVFTNQPMFAAFETNAVNNPNSGTSTIVYHTLSDKFLVACHKPQMSKSLARTVCWGVAGGYVERYRSNAKLPEWVRQGTRDWVARTMFPDAKAESSDSKKVRSELSKSGSLLGIMSATEFPAERRTIARSLVAYLIKTNPVSYGQFFQDLKLGQPWETALATNYGVKGDQFAQSFGRNYGVANLRQ